MLNHEQLLKLIREKVEHPATPREMLQKLKIPREERPTLKRLLKDLVASGDLIETRGNRYGLPDRMNLVVGRVTTAVTPSCASTSAVPGAAGSTSMRRIASASVPGPAALSICLP